MRKMAGAVTVLVALLVAGCGGDDDPTVSGGSPTTAMDDHGSASATCSPAGTTVSIVASGSTFDKECLAAPAGQPFKISVENKDTAVHSLVILESHSATEPLVRVDPFGGPKTTTLDVAALKAGTYAFHCEVHPAKMQGTFVVA